MSYFLCFFVDLDAFQAKTDRRPTDKALDLVSRGNKSLRLGVLSKSKTVPQTQDKVPPRSSYARGIGPIALVGNVL